MKHAGGGARSQHHPEGGPQRASVPRRRQRGGARPQQGVYLRFRSDSPSAWHRLLISAAATLASHGWRKACGPLLHLRSHTLVRVPLLRRPSSRSHAFPMEVAWLVSPGSDHSSLLGVPAYLPQRRPAGCLGGPVSSVVHRPWPQGAGGIKVHGVGLLPGNVPQGHHRLGEENRTITFANIFPHRIISSSPHNGLRRSYYQRTTEEMAVSRRLRDLPKALCWEVAQLYFKYCPPTPVHFRSLP